MYDPELLLKDLHARQRQREAEAVADRLANEKRDSLFARWLRLRVGRSSSSGRDCVQGRAGESRLSRLSALLKRRDVAK